MKIHQNITQGSDEWLALRALNFTASELGAWALEPVRVTLTVERDDFTDRLEEGLKTMVQEKAKLKAKLAAIWKGAHA